MSLFKSLLAPLMLASTLAGAQAPIPERRAPPVDVASLLGLDAPRAAQVEAILASAHEKVRAARREIGRPVDDATRATLHAALHAIHGQADQQLSAILTPDELRKLRQALRPARAPWVAPAPAPS